MNTVLTAGQCIKVVFMPAIWPSPDKYPINYTSSGEYEHTVCSYSEVPDIVKQEIHELFHSEYFIHDCLEQYVLSDIRSDIYSDSTCIYPAYNTKVLSIDLYLNGNDLEVEVTGRLINCNEGRSCWYNGQQAGKSQCSPSVYPTLADLQEQVQVGFWKYTNEGELGFGDYIGTDPGQYTVNISNCTCSLC